MKAGSEGDWTGFLHDSPIEIPWLHLVFLERKMARPRETMPDRYLRANKESRIHLRPVPNHSKTQWDKVYSCQWMTNIVENNGSCAAWGIRDNVPDHIRGQSRQCVNIDATWTKNELCHDEVTAWRGHKRVASSIKRILTETTEVWPPHLEHGGSCEGKNNFSYCESSVCRSDCELLEGDESDWDA